MCADRLRAETQAAHLPGGLRLLAAGSGWIAVDKPPGVSVHNQPGRDACSLAEKGISAQPLLGDRIGCLPPFRFSPAHRLDRETGGVLLLACRSAVLHRLVKAFESRQVRKSYLAVVSGSLSRGAGGGWRTWDAPLSSGPGGRRHPAGALPRVPAVTRYRVWFGTRDWTLIACRPLTGRQHQIRRHASLAGHPVLGDRRYGCPAAADALFRETGVMGLALHCRCLSWPLADGRRQVVASGIPERFRRLIDPLRRHRGLDDAWRSPKPGFGKPGGS